MSGSILDRGFKKLKRRKDRQQKQAARQAYKTYLQTLPLEEKTVILEARNGHTIDGNIYYLLKELLTAPEYADFTIYTVAEDDAAQARILRKLSGISGSQTGGPQESRPADRVKILRLHSADYYRVMASAKYLVNDASIANFFIKKEGQVYLNVWHGTPLKNMGRKVSHEPHATGNVQKNFIIADYLLYPSEYMMDHMIEDYMIGNLSKAQILLGGYPRNTAFFDGEQRLALRGRIARDIPAAAEAEEGLRIYAYMPTWRPTLMGESLQAVLDEIDRQLQTNELMYVNIHPLAREGVDFRGFEKIRPFPEDLETYAFLNVCDALLTDYSSVFYDFAVTGRNIVLLTYDEEEYFSTRGLYEPISSLPFPQVKTTREAVEALRASKAYDDGPFLDKYCRYESAEAAGALCREVFLGEPSDILEHRSMPDNGKQNILVYGGDLAPGERTDQVMDFLKDADREHANFYLTFNRADLTERFQILFDLPEGIDYIGRAGNMWLDETQQQAADRFNKGKLSFAEYWDTVKPAFAQERKRYYGDMRIDEILLIPAGKAPGPDASKEELEFAAYADSADRQSRTSAESEQADQ